MKRDHKKPSNTSSRRPRRAAVREIDSRRLAEARGGAGLGIIVHGGSQPEEDIMTAQHNETLVQL